jgi:hypothetical protein
MCNFFEKEEEIVVLKLVENMSVESLLDIAILLELEFKYSISIIIIL